MSSITGFLLKMSYTRSDGEVAIIMQTNTTKLQQGWREDRLDAIDNTLIHDNILYELYEKGYVDVNGERLVKRVSKNYIAEALEAVEIGDYENLNEYFMDKYDEEWNEIVMDYIIEWNPLIRWNISTGDWSLVK
jgi:hypothetical protein